MSNEVFTREEVTLQDGTEVELRPLVIGKKRKFMKLWSDHVASVNEELRKAIMANEALDPDAEAVKVDQNAINDRTFDVYIQLSSIGLDEYKGDRTAKQFTEYLESTLDEPTILKILEVCGNITFDEQELPN